MKYFYIILSLISLNAFSQNTVCDSFQFIDNGGINNNYSPNSNVTTTICPDNYPNFITITFTSFNVESFNDGLYIYNGTNVNPDNLISSGNPAGLGIMSQPGAFWGSSLPGPFTSTTPDGCLTFVFLSDSSVQSAGWVANMTCNSVQSGFKLNAFVDSNNNNVKDSNEIDFPNGEFSVQKNGGAVNYLSSYNGQTQIFEDNVANNYNFNYIIDPAYSAFCTASVSSYFNQNIVISPNLVTLNFPIVCQPYNDASVSLLNVTHPRAGFQYRQQLQYINYSSQIVASGTITYNADPANYIVSTSDSVNTTANGFTYSFTNLQPFETRFINIDLLVPSIPAVTIGQLLTANALISTSLTETLLANNESTLTADIRAAYDPNDMTESHGEEILLSSFAPNDYLTYTIRFENTGNAAAESVRIDDLLDAKIDETSIKTIAASANYQLTRNANNLSWKFANIFLPPSVDASQIGKGFVTFKAKLKPGFVVGTIVPILPKFILTAIRQLILTFGRQNLLAL